MSSEPAPSRFAETFDEDYDVAVIGYGFAGAVTALEASRAGARVLLIEKSEVPGGISICSYGSVRSALDVDEAFAYLSATNGGRTPEDVNRMLAVGMTEVEAYVRELASINGAEVEGAAQSLHDGETNGGNYPFPGFETFYHTRITKIAGFDARETYPWAHSPAPSGKMLFKLLEDNRTRFPFEIRMATRALRLITGGGEIIGLTVGSGGRMSRIRTRKGVVLACGGFENNPAMQQQFWEGKPVLAAAGKSNTGDGIVMAQDVGAALWHMWHFHGSYGFKYPDPAYPYGIRAKRLPDWLPGRAHAADVKMAWILLDRFGRRYMNEYDPYLQDTAHRPMHLFDPLRQDFSRIPSLLVCDEEGRKLYPLGRPTSNDKGLRLEWSDDNLAEVDLGIINRADTVRGLAGKMGTDADLFEASIARWNASCRAGTDADFNRPPGTMMPIAKPPFYCGEVWPIVSNTQGGPVHDARQRVIDGYGEPIPRLFAAGDCGSAFGHLYMSGGNISECFIGGRIAGKNVVKSG